MAKKKRNSGQEYVGRNTRKIVAACRVGAPCEYPKGCFEKLGEEAVQRVFNEYWKMGDFNIFFPTLKIIIVLVLYYYIPECLNKHTFIIITHLRT